MAGNMFNGQYAEDSVSSRPEMPVARPNNLGQARPQEPVNKSVESVDFNDQLERLERNAVAAAIGAPNQPTAEPNQYENAASSESVNINVLRQPVQDQQSASTGQPMPMLASIESVPNRQMLAPHALEQVEEVRPLTAPQQ